MHDYDIRNVIDDLSIQKFKETKYLFELDELRVKNNINHLLEFLSSRERKIIELRYGLINNKAISLKEAGEIFKLKPKVVAKIEEAALAKIKNYVKEFELNHESLPLTKGKEVKLIDLPHNYEIVNVNNEVYKSLIKELGKNPEKMKTLNWRLFEEIIAEIFNKFGYDVELTMPTRDGGRDVIAIQKREVYVKYLIECKRPDQNTKIGIGPVRSLYGVQQDERATKAILATTAFFTAPAKLFFERHKWELEPRDYNGIIEWIKQYHKK